MAGPQIGASPDGTVVLAAARMWIVPPGSPGWDADAAGLIDADTLIARGTLDGGWDVPIVVDGRRSTDEWAIPCGPPLAFGGGRWYFPVERHARTHVADWLRGYHAFALRSTDDGRTWPEQPDMPNDPDRVVAHYDQRAALLPDGRIAALAWAHDVVHDETLTARISWSDDGGRTWSETLDTGIVGGPLNPLALPDGRLLVVYPRRTTPRGIRARLSDDGGRTWGPETILFDEASGRLVGHSTADQARLAPDPPLWGSMWGWTFGQPVPVALDDGTVGVCFFGQVDDRMPAVHFLQLAPDDAPTGSAG
jgi:Neuraminidase (sialidase)